MQNMYSYEYDLKPLDFGETSSFLEQSLKKYERNECERLIHESFYASFKDDDVLPTSYDNVYDIPIFEKSQDGSNSDLSPIVNPTSKLLPASSCKYFAEESSNKRNSNGILVTEECSDDTITNALDNFSGITSALFNENPVSSYDFSSCWHSLFNSTMLDHNNGIPFLKMKPSIGREPFTSMLSKPMKQPNLYDNGQSEYSKNQSTTKSLKSNFHCSFCFNNERVRCERQKIEFNASNPKGLWNKHNNKNDKGIVTCPFLRKLVCPSCGATGDYAHTRKLLSFTIKFGGKKESAKTSTNIFKSLKNSLNKKLMRKTALNNIYQPCKLPDICLNGGTCSNTGNNFECHCPVHFYGKHCQHVANLEHCSNNKCFSLKNSKGETILQSTCYSIEKPINVSNPDLENPAAINKELEYENWVKKLPAVPYQPISFLDPETKGYIEVQYGCWCSKGRTGYFCEYKINNEECDYDTCNSHGKPIYDEKKRTCNCECHNGWSGIFCEKETLCKNIFCGYGGTCDENTGKCKCINVDQIVNLYPVKIEGPTCDKVELINENFKMKVPCKASFLDYLENLTITNYRDYSIEKVLDLTDIYQLIKNCNENRIMNNLQGDCDKVLRIGNCYGKNSICKLKIWDAPFKKPGHQLNYTGNPEIDYKIRASKKDRWRIIIPSCICENTRSGTFCELENINPCNSNPCQNKGKCIPLKYLDYKCDCENGTSGRNCEIKDPCFDNPCEWPGSICIRREQVNGMTITYKYDCICPEVDSHNRVCQNSGNGACKNHKCKNNGHCALCPDINGNFDGCLQQDINQGYRCICSFGHNGRYCDKESNVCDYNLCQKNSTCQVDKNNPFNYKCNCKPGYTGKFCRLLTDCIILNMVTKLTQLEIQKLNFGYNSVTKKISDCSKKFNKNTTLVAVSKYYSAEHIKYLYHEHNVRIFGESRVKDFRDKAIYLENTCPDIKWHFIGKLQSNKINQLLNIKNIDMIQTIEDKKHATLLNEVAEKLNYADKSLNVMVQVNVCGEIQKQGCNPDEVLDILNHIVENCPKLNLSGLMMIGEKHELNEREKAEEEFSMLHKLKNELENKNKNLSLKLSMGMSGDYDIAIKCGSDFVRVGTSLFDPELPMEETK